MRAPGLDPVSRWPAVIIEPDLGALDGSRKLLSFLHDHGGHRVSLRRPAY
jgi:hypothetical protein